MKDSFLQGRGAISSTLGHSSLAQLLQHGTRCFRQGQYGEGIASFALVRERLPAAHVQLANMLDALKQSYTMYVRTQEALFEASRCFTKVDTELQTQLVLLENILSSLIGAANTDLTRTLDNEFPIEEPIRENGAGKQALPGLYITCFGHFEVTRQGKPVTLCSNRKGQTILRYLVVQPEHRATMDTLMAVLWPEDEADVAQNKLYLAISALRRALHQGCSSEDGCEYLLRKNRVYHLNTVPVIHTDVDDFLHFYQAGQRATDPSQRVALYEQACRLYTGPFLPEDIYADWSFLQREQLSKTYLSMCTALTEYYLVDKRFEDAAKRAALVLKENRCDETAHRLLIQIYTAQGRRSEALLQYQCCESILREELGVEPLPETMQAFHALFTGCSDTSSIIHKTEQTPDR